MMHLRLKFTMKLWDSVIAASNLVLQCCKESQSLFSFMMLNSKFEKGGPNANDISGDELAGPVFSKWLCPLCWQVLFSCYSSKAKQGYGPLGHSILQSWCRLKCPMTILPVWPGLLGHLYHVPKKKVRFSALPAFQRCLCFYPPSLPVNCCSKHSMK